MEKPQLDRYLRILFALAETIRELRQVPNGELYAAVMVGKGLTFGEYSAMITTLKRAGLVSESAYVLRWIGPDPRNN